MAKKLRKAKKSKNPHHKKLHKERRFNREFNQQTAAPEEDNKPKSEESNVQSELKTSTIDETSITLKSSTIDETSITFKIEDIIEKDIQEIKPTSTNLIESYKKFIVNLATHLNVDPYSFELVFSETQPIHFYNEEQTEKKKICIENILKEIKESEKRAKIQADTIKKIALALEKAKALEKEALEKKALEKIALEKKALEVEAAKKEEKTKMLNTNEIIANLKLLEKEEEESLTEERSDSSSKSESSSKRLSKLSKKEKKKLLRAKLEEKLALKVKSSENSLEIKKSLSKVTRNPLKQSINRTLRWEKGDKIINIVMYDYDHYVTESLEWDLNAKPKPSILKRGLSIPDSYRSI